MLASSLFPALPRNHTELTRGTTRVWVLSLSKPWAELRSASVAWLLPCLWATTGDRLCCPVILSPPIQAPLQRSSFWPSWEPLLWAEEPGWPNGAGQAKSPDISCSHIKPPLGMNWTQSMKCWLPAKFRGGRLSN